MCGVLCGFGCLFDFLCVVSCVFPRGAGTCVICCFKSLIRVFFISLRSDAGDGLRVVLVLAEILEPLVVYFEVVGCVKESLGVFVVMVL